MEKLTIEAVDREKLTEDDFIGIHEVMQDMWASESWLGELAQCNNCGMILSKEKVFWHLSEDLIQRKVAHIMQILWIDSVRCTACSSENTRLIYGPNNIERIKDRVLGSIDAFVVLCKSDEKGIVGFEEAYVDSLDRIFQLDLIDHYENIWIPEISQRVNILLGYVPNEMFLLSSLGLLGPYQNFQNLFQIMSQFAQCLPNSYLGTPWLTELNHGGVTDKMNEGINEGISLGIKDNFELRTKITRVWEWYNSDIIIYHNPVKIYQERFTNGMRYFLKSLRKPKLSIRQE